MKHENVFDFVQKTMRIRNIIWSIIFAAISALFGWGGVSIFLDSDSSWKLRFRGTTKGIAVPGWLVALFFLVLAIVMLCVFVYNIKSIIKEEDYKKFIDKVRKLGDEKTINEALSKIEKSPYAKANLRFDDKYMFYMAGTDATVIEMSSIIRINPIIEQHKNHKEYFVAVYYGRTANDVIKINTKKKNVQPLCESFKEKLSQKA